MKPNRVMDWVLVIVPGMLSIKYIFDRDWIYAVVWGVISVLYLIYALQMWKKDRAAGKEESADGEGDPGGHPDPPDYGES